MCIQKGSSAARTVNSLVAVQYVMPGLSGRKVLKVKRRLIGSSRTMTKYELITKLLITKNNALTLQFLDKYCEKERKLTKHEQRIIKSYHERIKVI